MAHERNRNGKYYCASGASGTARLGAACDFRIIGLESGGDSLCDSTYCLVEWILEQQLPFDSLYNYGSDSRFETLRKRPIHITYGLLQRRSIWAFTNSEMPTREGIEDWVDRAKHGLKVFDPNRFWQS